LKPPCTSAAEALANSPLAGLIEQARLLGQVTALVVRFCQETDGAGRCLPAPRCALQGRKVIITVGTPSQAARIRQQTVALHQLLQAGFPELTGIRVRLQPSHPVDIDAVAEPGGTAGSALPAPADLESALQFADNLSTTLRDSPLRRSAMRLRNTLRTRLRSAK
jgi:hypothetical protein